MVNRQPLTSPVNSGLVSLFEYKGFLIYKANQDQCLACNDYKLSVHFLSVEYSFQFVLPRRSNTASNSLFTNLIINTLQ